jgi:hypothetical protein
MNIKTPSSSQWNFSNSAICSATSRDRYRNLKGNKSPSRSSRDLILCMTMDSFIGTSSLRYAILVSRMHMDNMGKADLVKNIMVVTKSPSWFVKIADFGISKRRHQDVTTLLTLQRGTLGFAAPEALGCHLDSTYTSSVDMWSLGAVAYRILTNTVAFQHLNDLFKYANGMSEFPQQPLESNRISEHGRAFIIKLMQPSQHARLSAALASDHPWITTPINVRDTTNTYVSADFPVEGQFMLT